MMIPTHKIYFCQQRFNAFDEKVFGGILSKKILKEN